MRNSTTRFSDRVSDYVKYRPSYPKEAITYILSEFAIQSNSVVADVGSGTGIFTELLLPFIETVYAVEPNAEMREAAVGRLRNAPNFRSVNGTSESTGIDDQSVDFIFAAQAAHWFDLPATKKEFLRILRPNGYVFLIWNKRQLNTDFLKGYESIVQSIPGYSEVSHHTLTESILKDFLGSNFKMRSFSNDQTLDFDGLMGRFGSSSYTPKEGTSEYFEIKEKLRKLFEGTAKNNEISFNYLTEVYSGRIA